MTERQGLTASNPRALRVAQVLAHASLGGATALAIRFAEALGTAGHEVWLVTGPQAGPEGEMLSEARGRGIRIEPILSFSREPHPAKDAATLWRLARFLRREGVDVVHCHGAKAKLLGMIAGFLARTPVRIMHSHGWEFHPFMSPATAAVYRWAARLEGLLATDIVVVSEANRRSGLAARVGRPCRYRLILSGADCERFRPDADKRAKARRELGVPAGTLVVGSVMRLCEQKRPQDLIEAARLVAREREDVQFVIIGDGPLHAETAARIGDAGMQARVHCLGERRDVDVLIHAFDVFALPSLWEGLPVSVLEALAAGKPVVATDVDGTGEAVIHGHTGLLVPPKEPEQMAAALLRLLGDSALRERMGRQAVEHAANFTIQRATESLLELYAARAVSTRLRHRTGR